MRVSALKWIDAFTINQESRTVKWNSPEHRHTLIEGKWWTGWVCDDKGDDILTKSNSRQCIEENVHWAFQSPGVLRKLPTFPSQAVCNAYYVYLGTNIRREDISIAIKVQREKYVIPRVKCYEITFSPLVLVNLTTIFQVNQSYIHQFTTCIKIEYMESQIFYCLVRKVERPITDIEEKLCGRDNPTEKDRT